MSARSYPVNVVLLPLGVIFGPFSGSIWIGGIPVPPPAPPPPAPTPPPPPPAPTFFRQGLEPSRACQKACHAAGLIPGGGGGVVASTMVPDKTTLAHHWA